MEKKFFPTDYTGLTGYPHEIKCALTTTSSHIQKPIQRDYESKCEG